MTICCVLLVKVSSDLICSLILTQKLKATLEVKARGTESLMANEVRSQSLMQFLQVASNPALAPFAKFQYVIREIAKSMDLDPDKVTNNMNEAALQAELMKQFQAPARARSDTTASRCRCYGPNRRRWRKYGCRHGAAAG